MKISPILASLSMLAALSLSACKQESVEAEPIRPAQVWQTQTTIAQQTETYSGEVKARQEVDLAFRVGGKLIERSVDIGTEVKQGQILARLDDEDSKLSVNQSAAGLQASIGSLSSAQSNLGGAQGRLASSKANLIAAQAGLETAYSAVETAKSSAAAAEAAVGVAQAEVDNAQLEYNRTLKLIKQGFASQAVLDGNTQRLKSAQANLKSVQSNAAAARAQVKSAESKVASTQAQVSAAEGDVAAANANIQALNGQIKSAQAQVDSTQEQLKLVKNQSGYTNLISSVDGVVTRTLVEAGQVVAAGQAVLTVAKAGEYEVQIRVGEQAIQQAKIDTPASIRLWADSNQSLQGKIREIAPAADANRTWLVKVAVDDPQQILKLGMTATVAFSQDLSTPVTWLPPTALFQQGEQAAVWLVDANKQTQLKPIKVERYLNNGLLVSGLEPNLTVIAAGATRVHAGQQVLPVPYNGEAKPEL
ncbi:MAG: efflux RND transporter periplasmic adaptor subunit [Thiothrix sp.]|nr:MAG: efflux RND transporter periplasmic adaptor subunit [Thiothrix sp.]